MHYKSAVSLIEMTKSSTPAFLSEVCNIIAIESSGKINIISDQESESGDM